MLLYKKKQLINNISTIIAANGHNLRSCYFELNKNIEDIASYDEKKSKEFKIIKISDQMINIF
jgi:hypothetical protein